MIMVLSLASRFPEIKQLSTNNIVSLTLFISIPELIRIELVSSVDKV